MRCPACGSEAERDEVDVGVGGAMMGAGPWGCPECAWIETMTPAQVVEHVVAFAECSLIDDMRDDLHPQQKPHHREVLLARFAKAVSDALNVQGTTTFQAVRDAILRRLLEMP